MIKSETHRAYCEAIKRRRIELGLTQVQLAARLGVHGATVAEAEAGKRDPTLSTVERFAKALEISVTALLESPVESAR